MNRLLRVGFVVLVVAFAAGAIHQRWSQVRDGFLRLDAGLVVLAAVLGAVSLVPSMLSWRALLAGLGSHLPVRAATRVFFIGQLGKYLPGSVWPIVAQMELGRAYGVPRTRAAAAALVAIGTGVVGALLVATALLPFAVTSPAARVALVLGLVTSLVVASPPVLNRCLALGLRVMHRQPLDVPLPATSIACSLGLSMLCWVMQGLAVDVLSRAAGGSGLRLLALSVGGYAVASALGILVVLAPAGIGVREPALVAALSSVVTGGTALLVALSIRLLLTAADLLLGGLATLLPRPPAEPAPVSAAEAVGDPAPPWPPATVPPTAAAVPTVRVGGGTVPDVPTSSRHARDPEVGDS